jgi:K(+)-stimulated pyrophosphate-energized sodium pump
MMLPGAIAIVSPLIIGFMPGLGAEALGGFLAGATVSGVLMGMFQNNAGGAWDNAKKSFEKGVEINGQMYYKKSEPHKASVTGDTVGDPFKDTSGPSMNILIKLMSIVSLVIAPTLAQISDSKAEAQTGSKKEHKMEMQVTIGDPAVNEDAGLKPLISALQEDGLIDGKNYSIELNSGELKINGKSLEKEVLAKYQPLLKMDRVNIKVNEN